MSRRQWNGWIAEFLWGHPSRRARRRWRGATESRRRFTRGIETLENRVVLSTAPLVTTGQADSIFASGATLTGSVNPEGSTTSVRFQYSTTSSFPLTVQTTIDTGFQVPNGVAMDSTGDVFVVDSGKNTVKEVLPNGSIKTIGSGFNDPEGVAVDSAGDVFVADTDNDAVKEVLPNGRIKTIGSGSNQPISVAVDSVGDVFVEHSFNDAVKEVLPNGSIKTIGSGFDRPSGLAVDAAGDVFVADSLNNAVKEVLPNGTITTIGSGFSNPGSVAVDATGDVFVGESLNNTVKEVLPNGNIKTIGSGFNLPNGVAVDSAGDVFVTNNADHQLVELSPASVAAIPSSLSGSSVAAVSNTLTGLVPGTDYCFRLVASGPGGTVVGQTLHFAAPETPALALGGPAVTYSQVGMPVALVASATLSTGDGAFADTSLSVVDTTFASHLSDRLSISSSGSLIVSGTSLIYGGAKVGDFTGAATGTLSITFNSAATEAAVQAVIQNVTFTAATLGSRSIQFQLTDGSGSLGTPETKTVDTALPATAVVTSPAGNVYQTGATLNGTVAPQGLTVTTRFQYSTGPSLIPSVQTTVLGYAGFDDPLGVAVDAAGDVFVADPGNNAIEEVLPNGSVKTIGSGFNFPEGVAVDVSGDVFVADSLNNAIKEVFPNGNIETIGSGFSEPLGVAVNASGDVFVADALNNAVKEVLPNGNIKAIGSGFHFPGGVAVDSTGDVFIADTDNDAVKEVLPNDTIKTIGSRFGLADGVAVDSVGDVFVSFNNAVKEVLPNGSIKTIGSGFRNPGGVAVDAAGDVFVADTNNKAVKEVLRDGGIQTIGSSFSDPIGVAVDGVGDVFRADHADDDVKEFLPDGSVKTIGSGFSNLSGVAVDDTGDVFVAETSTSYYGVPGIFGAVQEILPDGTVRPIGMGFNHPSGVAVDAAGDVFVADSGNNAVKEVLPDGTILTIGSGFSNPRGVAVDTSGDVFVADTGDHAVKEVLPNGNIESIGYGFSSPSGVAVDAFGDAFVSETTENDVKEVLPDGTITTIGSVFNEPAGVAVDGAGDLYVLDTAVVKFSPPTVAATPSTVSGTSPVAVSATLTALSADTHYYFRLLASNAGGTFFGQTLDFITPPQVSISVQQVSYAIGGVAVALAPTAALSNPTGDGGFANTSLTISDTNAGATDQLSIQTSSGATTAAAIMPIDLAALGAPSAGGVAIVGSTLIDNFTDIGTFTGGSGTTPLIINFTSVATATDVTAVLQSISFDITNLVPGNFNNRQVTLQFTNHSGISTPVTQTISFSNVISSPATFSGDTSYELTGTYLYNNTVTIENGGAGSVDLDDPTGNLIFLSTVDSPDGSQLTVSAASVQFYAAVGGTGKIDDLTIETSGPFALGANITTTGDVTITSQPSSSGNAANVELQPGVTLSAGGQVKLLSSNEVNVDPGSTIIAGSLTIFADYAGGNQFNNTGASINLAGTINSQTINVQGGSNDPLYLGDAGGQPGTETANTITGYGLQGTLTFSGVRPAVAPYNAYVEAVFNDVLRRPADPAGLQYWTQQLASGMPISSVAQEIVRSAEYFQKFVISPDYLKLLGRPADATGLKYWTPLLQNDMMTDQELEADLVSSQEFYANAGGTNTDWIYSVFQLLLGRPVDTGGLNYWNGELSNGMTLSQAAMGIANSTENNAELINADYLHYLGRPADSGGLTYWLQQFGTGATNEDVIAGFTGSTEYFEKANGIKSS